MSHMSSSNLTRSVYSSVASSNRPSQQQQTSRDSRQQSQNSQKRSSTGLLTTVTTSTPTKIKSSISSSSSSSLSSLSKTSSESSRFGLAKRKIVSVANELLRVCASLGFEYETAEIASVRDVRAKLFVFFYESILGMPLESNYLFKLLELKFYF